MLLGGVEWESWWEWEWESGKPKYLILVEIDKIDTLGVFKKYKMIMVVGCCQR